MIKKAFHIIEITLLSMMAFVVLYLLFAFMLSHIEITAEKQTSQDVTIYIMTNGDHIDFVLPTRNSLMDWSKKIKTENTEGKDSTLRYLALGWGDKGFYLDTPTWAELKFKTAFNAVFGLGSTAMHATYYECVKEGLDCKKLTLSKDQYVRLIKYIDQSFLKDAAGHYINIKTKANYDDDDAFYEAIGNYNLFHTCNTWANNGLKVCGQKACLWTPFDKGVFYQYNK